jgi:hypothetical protein
VFHPDFSGEIIVIQTLYNSDEVRKAITRIFRNHTVRRVAIVAFVGESARLLLPNPAGLELICWPKAGGTSPNALRELAKNKVDIRFADRLHTKLYWADGEGAVVTSANLSRNALGSGDLKEFGIACESRDINIERVIADLAARPMTERELRKLDRSHDAWMVRNPARMSRNGNSFTEWYSSIARKDWKLSCWEGKALSWSSNAKEIVRRDYGLTEPEKGFTDDRNNGYKSHDWVLTFRAGRSGADQIEWQYVDYVIEVDKKDRAAYRGNFRFEVAQASPDKNYPAPPFRLDVTFKKAFKSATQSIVKKDTVPLRLSAKLFEIVHEKYLNINEA